MLNVISVPLSPALRGGYGGECSSCFSLKISECIISSFWSLLKVLEIIIIYLGSLEENNIKVHQIYVCLKLDKWFRRKKTARVRLNYVTYWASGGLQTLPISSCSGPGTERLLHKLVVFSTRTVTSDLTRSPYTTAVTLIQLSYLDRWEVGDEAVGWLRQRVGGHWHDSRRGRVHYRLLVRQDSRHSHGHCRQTGHWRSRKLTQDVQTHHWKSTLEQKTRKVQH